MIDNCSDAIKSGEQLRRKKVLECLVAERQCLNDGVLLKQTGFPGADAWFRLVLVGIGATAQAYAQ